MTHNTAQRETLDNLLFALRDDELNRQQESELERLVLTDPDAMQHYLRVVNLCVGLRWMTGGGYDGHAAPVFDASPQCLPLGERSGSPSFPVLSFLGSAAHGTIGFFSEGMPLSYLIAAALMGFWILVASLVPVSHHTEFARQFGSSSSANIDRQLPPASRTAPVARVTGMVDCRWEKKGLGIRDWGLDKGAGGGGQGSGLPSPDQPSVGARRGAGGEGAQSPIPNPQSLVHLGDKFALASGLMQLTYDSGANVILQGPCTYEVDSPAGGFLSVGKLTARVESAKTRAEGGPRRAEKAANPKSQISKSQISNPQSLIPNPSLSTLHSPLFTVTTPTATITDLGTEFGIEVSDEGITTSHVFQGLVAVQYVGADGEKGRAIQLAANESVRIDKHGKTGRQPTVNTAAFVRSLRQHTVGKEIPVENGGFELPALAEHGMTDRYGGRCNFNADSPSGWRKAGIAGVLSGGDAPIGPNVADAGQWGYCNAKSDLSPANGVLYQAVAAINPAVDYTLSADVAVQTHWGQGCAYKLSLWAGQGDEPVEELAAQQATSYVNPQRATVVSPAARHAALAGQNLFVRFECVGPSQVLVDNVQVIARQTPNPPKAQGR